MNRTGKLTTAQQIAESFWEIPFTGLDRPVIDQTGLVGSYDFKVEFAPDLSGSGARSQADMGAPTFGEALKEQLGLELKTSTGSVKVLVIDHIEPPKND